MVGGCTCGTNFKIGTGFDFVAKQKPYGSAGSWCMSGYCGELGAWIGDSWYPNSSAADKIPWLHATAGGVINITSSTGYTSESLANAITPCNFCEFSYTTSGNGSISDSATKYQGKYRKSGDATTITASPSNGYKVSKLLVNGSSVDMTGYVSGPKTYSINNIQQDYSIVAYFVPTQYQVTCNAPTGGTVTFTKTTSQGTTTTETAPFYANVDDAIVCTATPNADKMVQNFVLDGTICSGGSTGPQNFSFSIFERSDDAVYNCAVSFSDRTSVVGYVSGKSDGSTEDATLTCDGAAVSRTDGKFSALIGNTYLATAATPTIFRSFLGWANANGEILSANAPYAWTQGSTAISITAMYADNPLYTETFRVGTSTSDYGSGSSAVVAGCTADIYRPTDTEKDGKWLGGTRTVTATNTPTGWSFSGVYVSDTDKSGGTKFYKANGASSVTFDNACNAYIYAIFANGGTVSPSDVDQGNSTIATGSSANGLYRWEGGSSSLTMRWHSKRFVASQPMTLSTARVYAEGYSTSGTNDVKLKTLTFQSPESTDAKAVDTTAKSQDAYRMPMRRPEKYIEMIVSAPHEVTQVAVATSMEALWQT